MGDAFSRNVVKFCTLIHNKSCSYILSLKPRPLLRTPYLIFCTAFVVAASHIMLFVEKWMSSTEREIICVYTLLHGDRKRRRMSLIQNFRFFSSLSDEVIGFVREHRKPIFASDLRLCLLYFLWLPATNRTSMAPDRSVDLDVAAGRFHNFDYAYM